jgi:hypothetical protein
MVSRIRNGICPYEDLSLTLTTKLRNNEIPPATRTLERQTLLWIWLVTIDSWSVGMRPVMLASRGMDLLKMLPERFPEVNSWMPEDFENLGKKKYFWWDNAMTWLRPAWARILSISSENASSPPAEQNFASTAVAILTHGSASFFCEEISTQRGPSKRPPHITSSVVSTNQLPPPPANVGPHQPHEHHRNQKAPTASHEPTPLTRDHIGTHTHVSVPVPCGLESSSPHLQVLGHKFVGLSVADRYMTIDCKEHW